MTKSQMIFFILISRRMSFPVKNANHQSNTCSFWHHQHPSLGAFNFCVNYHIGRSCVPAESLACKAHSECRPIYVAADLALL